MADDDWFSGEAGGEEGGKSGKKNQKRRAKAKKGKGGISQENQVDPVEEIRQRLADAKINKDHTLAGKLRQQLWIVQDLAAGVKPKVDEDDKDGQAMVDEFERTGIISLPSNDAEAEEKASKSEPVFFTPVAGGAMVEDKQFKNLKKKLKQIETLKEKQKKGEKLESNQLEKIKSEASVRKEIQETEELISRLSAEIKS